MPHQTIGYLWPSGPWYWTFQHLGVPDWIAQRLWIGTILFAAGAGVRWCAKQLGLAGVLAPLAAAVVYQMSPYVLPYISRTSVLLLPWAGLGWLIGLTVNAGRRGGWRDPALFALVVLTDRGDQRDRDGDDRPGTDPAGWPMRLPAGRSRCGGR